LNNKFKENHLHSSTIYGNKNKFNILDLQCPKKSKKTEGFFQSQNRKVKNKPYRTKQKERRKEGRKIQDQNQNTDKNE
jgi:hypothetical protein